MTNSCFQPFLKTLSPIPLYSCSSLKWWREKERIGVGDQIVYVLFFEGENYSVGLSKEETLCEAGRRRETQSNAFLTTRNPRHVSSFSNLKSREWFVV